MSKNRSDKIATDKETMGENNVPQNTEHSGQRTTAAHTRLQRTGRRIKNDHDATRCSRQPSPTAFPASCRAVLHCPTRRYPWGPQKWPWSFPQLLT